MVDTSKQNLSIDTAKANETKMRVAVNLILINEKGEIYLQLRGGKKAGADTWAIPGGTQGLLETMEQCIIREAREELGIVIKEEDLIYNNMFECLSTPEKHYFHHAFVCKKWEGTPKNVETEKCKDSRWFSVDAIKKIPRENMFISYANLDNYFNGVAYNPKNTIVAYDQEAVLNGQCK